MHGEPVSNRIAQEIQIKIHNYTPRMLENLPGQVTGDPLEAYRFGRFSMLVYFCSPTTGIGYILHFVEKLISNRLNSISHENQFKINWIQLNQKIDFIDFKSSETPRKITMLLESIWAQIKILISNQKIDSIDFKSIIWIVIDFPKNVQCIGYVSDLFRNIDFPWNQSHPSPTWTPPEQSQRGT